MFKTGISLLRDITSVISSDSATVIVEKSVISSDSATVIIEKGEVYVSHRYREHNIITHFKGDGVMNIYRCSDISNLETANGILYDTHWNSNPEMGYRAKLKELCGE